MRCIKRNSKRELQMLTDTSTGEIRLSEPERRRLAYWCAALPEGVKTPEGLRRFAEQQKLLYPGDTPEEQLMRGLIDQSVVDILSTSVPLNGAQAPDVQI